MWPAWGITSSRALGIASAIDLASAGGVITSSSPTKTRVGTDDLGQVAPPVGPARHAAQGAGDSCGAVCSITALIGSTRSGCCSRVILAKETRHHRIDDRRGTVGGEDGLGRRLAALGRLGRVRPGSRIHQHQGT